MKRGLMESHGTPNEQMKEDRSKTYKGVTVGGSRVDVGPVTSESSLEQCCQGCNQRADLLAKPGRSWCSQLLLEELGESISQEESWDLKMRGKILVTTYSSNHLNLKMRGGNLSNHLVK